MIEYKTERVSPRDEDSVNEINANFGWHLLDAQDVYNEDTHISNVEIRTYGDGFYGSFMRGYTGSSGTIKVQQHTNVTHFAALRFGRDTSMPNYDEILQLEAEFYSTLDVAASQPKAPKIFTGITVIGILLIVISIIMAIVNGTEAAIWEIAVCIIFPVVTIPLTVFFWKRYKKRMAVCNRAQEKAYEILASAYELLEEASDLTE